MYTKAKEAVKDVTGKMIYNFILSGTNQEIYFKTNYLTNLKNYLIEASTVRRQTISN
jgi:hypothetical protein